MLYTSVLVVSDNQLFVILMKVTAHTLLEVQQRKRVFLKKESCNEICFTHRHFEVKQNKSWEGGGGGTVEHANIQSPAHHLFFKRHTHRNKCMQRVRLKGILIRTELCVSHNHGWWYLFLHQMPVYWCVYKHSSVIFLNIEMEALYFLMFLNTQFKV